MRFDVSLPEQEKILQFIFVKSLERKQKRPYAAVILRHMGALCVFLLLRVKMGIKQKSAIFGDIARFIGRLRAALSHSILHFL